MFIEPYPIVLAKVSEIKLTALIDSSSKISIIKTLKAREASLVYLLNLYIAIIEVGNATYPFYRVVKLVKINIGGIITRTYLFLTDKIRYDLILKRL